MAFDWGSLIDPALGTAGNIAGAVITNKLGGNTAQNSVNEQKRQFDITQQQRDQMLARQDEFRRMAMPGLLTNLGKLPSQARSITDAYRTPSLGTVPGSGGSGGSSLASKMGMVGLGAAGGYAANELINRDSGGGFNPEMKRIIDMGVKLGLPAAGGALGLGGAAAGAGAGAGTTAAATGGAAAGSGGIMGTLGALATNPITLIGAGALGAGLLVKKLVGRGRESADKLTGEGGLQRSFDETMGDIDRMPNLSPDQKWNIKQQEYNTLVRLGLERANKGGKDALTTWQMFNTISPLFGRPNPMGPNRPS